MPSTLARVALGAIAAAELTAAAGRFQRRRDLYRLARQRAQMLRRKLVVVGDPDTGLHTRLARAYGCGDVCVDLTGCPGCPRGVAADLTRGPTPGIPEDSAVVFVSEVLEYIPDVQRAWAEIMRMAGRRANVFLVAIEPWTVTGALYPDARWHVAPAGHALQATPVTAGKKLLYAGALGLLVLAAL